MKTNVMEKPDLAQAAERILEKYLTVQECAQFLRIAEATVRYHLSHKTLRRFKCQGRTLIKLSDAESLIKEVS
jgi:Fic family protein